MMPIGVTTDVVAVDGSLIHGMASTFYYNGRLVSWTRDTCTPSRRPVAYTHALSIAKHWSTALRDHAATEGAAAGQWRWG
jgi:hypothetical protein